MNILLLEPWFGGSHRVWAEGYARHSAHDVQLLTLPAQFWKWRMQGAAVTLAREIRERGLKPDVILASGMMNVATLRALLPTPAPLALYLHENQLTYPQNRRQRHGWQYGFVNYVSALAADRVFFNSAWHRGVFLDELPRMLRHFGDCNEEGSVECIRQKAGVLAPGMELARLDRLRPAHVRPEATALILWNHRWDEDKNPVLFLDSLLALAADGVPFRVALAGANERQAPAEFEAAREQLGERVVQYGHVGDEAAYGRLLWSSDYVVSAANQDFFGMAVVEAIYCGCVPILPQRLNYPNLVPQAWHAQCLYRRNRLAPLLLRHLHGQFQVPCEALRDFVAEYDWQVQAPLMDHALEQLAGQA